jgi:dihydroorotate dehydrogenase
MTEQTILSETFRHLRQQEWAAAGDVLRHEGLKRGVEQVLYRAGMSETGRNVLELASGADYEDDISGQLTTELGGIAIAGPTGIGAGWDKTGRSILAWQALGAHHITVGGVPYFPQTGNAMPRLFTMDKKFGDHGRTLSLNRYGFYSPGAAEVVDNITEQRNMGDVSIPVGVQVTLNKEFYEPASRRLIPEMLAMTIRKVLPVADFISLGMSSPNTLGMRDAQDEEEFMRACLGASRAAASTSNRHVELYYKTDGDGGPERIDAISQLVVEHDLDGLELINTTARMDIKGKYQAQDEQGGLAGTDPDYQQMALDSVRRAYQNIGDFKKIHGMGGINSLEQNMRMIGAGASVTSINSYVRQGGRRAITNVEQGMAAELQRRGIGSIHDLVGKDAAEHV